MSIECVWCATFIRCSSIYIQQLYIKEFNLAIMSSNDVNHISVWWYSSGHSTSTELMMEENAESRKRFTYHWTLNSAYNGKHTCIFLQSSYCPSIPVIFSEILWWSKDKDFAPFQFSFWNTLTVLCILHITTF